MPTANQINIALNRAILKAAFDMEAHAKRTCPAVTGRLRNSIRFRIEEGSIILGAYTDYASYVELGTVPMVKAHGKHDPESPIKSWKALKERGGRGQTMPFIRPALHAGLRRYLPKRIKEELSKIPKS